MTINAFDSFFLRCTLILSICYSCNQANKDHLDSSYLKTVAGTEKVKISTVNETSLIELEYTTDNKISSEYIASFVAMSYCDSVGDNLSKNKIERISIHVGFPEYMDTFLYNVSLMKEYKKGLESTASFIDNLLNYKSERSQKLVDPTKISNENLIQLNDIGREIQQNFRPTKISYDGFLIIPSESNKIQSKVRFVNASEEMYVSFQYDMNTGKIFYFGVND